MLIQMTLAYCTGYQSVVPSQSWPDLKILQRKKSRSVLCRLKGMKFRRLDNLGVFHVGKAAFKNGGFEYYQCLLQFFEICEFRGTSDTTCFSSFDNVAMVRSRTASCAWRRDCGHAGRCQWVSSITRCQMQ